MGHQIESSVGVRTVADGRTMIQTRPGDSGWALFGPYVALPPGAYAVTFRLRAATSYGSPYDTIASVDVCAGTGGYVLVASPITRNDLTRQAGSVTLSFTTSEAGVFEFRVYANGTAGLVVEGDWVLTAKGQTLLGPADAPSSTPGTDHRYGGFLLRHLSEFKALVANGASVEPDDEGATVTLHGVTLHVRNTDDFQVITEVFLHRDYAFAAPRDTCVIDVGMNVGIASLFFATQPWVREIHAFEPFQAPYHRGLRNFALNPAHAQKIHPHNSGLGNENATHTVLYTDEGTIGASVLGLDQGTPSHITIQDASDVFRTIIDAARAKGYMVVVKLDCEGSEFSIFETLGNSGLLGEPDAYLIEWHKWWNGGITQETLVTPLLDRGYTVIDLTRDSNPHAGQIYAVRTRH